MGGPVAHLSQVFAYDDFLTEDGVWRLMPIRPPWSASRAAGLAVEYAAEKLENAYSLICLFPDSGALKPTSAQNKFLEIEVSTGAKKNETSQDARPKRASAGLAGLLSSVSKHAAESSVNLEERRQAIEKAKRTLQSVSQAARTSLTKNRLNCALTELQVRRICATMYCKIGANDATATTATIRFGNLEGLLLSWDLTSHIEGAWRLPLTLTCKKDTDVFDFVWTVLLCDQHVGMVGKNASRETSFFPSGKAKIVEYFTTSR